MSTGGVKGVQKNDVGYCEGITLGQKTNRGTYHL
jgi:hypothetical protein